MHAKFAAFLRAHDGGTGFSSGGLWSSRLNGVGGVGGCCSCPMAGMQRFA
jgi:hypothetical protein